jgi:hypothetical protein
MTDVMQQESTAVPAWLDLDAAVPPPVREGLAEAADHLEGLLDELSAACWTAYQTLNNYDATANAADVNIEDIWLTLDRVSGAARVYRALDSADALIACARRDGNDLDRERGLWPSWYTTTDPEAARPLKD